MRIVIVGGGFAGVKAARTLTSDNRFDVTLISTRQVFEYHAALYRSATGRSPLEVVVPLKEIFTQAKNVEVAFDTVVRIDAEEKQVSGESGISYPYDALILAPGVVTASFGIKGLDEHAYGIKSIDEAMRLKAHLHNELTGAAKPDLNYVVVGAGPTGVELAAELVSYLNILRKRHGVVQKFQVSLVEAAPRILPSSPVAFSSTILHRLRKLGIKIYTSTAVKGETASTLQLPEGSIETHTVIWTAGAMNNPLFEKHKELFNFGGAGKIKPVENLRVTESIWVAGDSALTPRSGFAQTAIYDGDYIAHSLKRQMLGENPLPYKPPIPIQAIPVGPNWCAIHMKNRSFYGYAGWLMRRWSDYKLYQSLLPFGLALKTWLMGNKLDEECEICRRALR